MSAGTFVIPSALGYANEELFLPKWTDQTDNHKTDMCNEFSVIEKGEVLEIFCRKKCVNMRRVIR